MPRFFYALADLLRHRLRSRRWPSDLASGRRGEDLAHRLLRRDGLTVVARNFRPFGAHAEIDLIAWDRDQLVFVEVKSRHSAAYGSPERAIGPEKRVALVHAAGRYARAAGVPWSRVRFDVVTVLLTDPPVVSRIEDAFRPSDA